MPLLRFRNFESGFRKAALKAFGLVPPGWDLSWIEGVPSSPPDRLNISGSIVGGSGQVFNIASLKGTDIIVVAYNGVMLEEGIGYTRSGTQITMASGYQPTTGDSLIVYRWGTAN